MTTDYLTRTDEIKRGLKALPDGPDEFTIRDMISKIHDAEIKLQIAENNLISAMTDLGERLTDPEDGWSVDEIRRSPLGTNAAVMDGVNNR